MPGKEKGLIIRMDGLRVVAECMSLSAPILLTIQMERLLGIVEICIAHFRT